MHLVLDRVITMDFMALIALLLGTTLGSFANVLIFRMEKLGTVVNTGSHCPYCRHALAWYDLIPVVSYVLLGGRCRYCQKPISLQYPLVEAALGALGVALYLQYGLSTVFFISLLMMTSLTVLLVYDLQTMRLPDAIVWPAFVLGATAFLFREGMRHDSLINMFLGVALGVVVLGALYVLGKGNWMGFGDVKLVAALGAFLGWPVIVVALNLAFLLGALVASILLATKLRTMQDPIPFGPFLVLGTVFALFWGEILIRHAKFLLW